MNEQSFQQIEDYILHRMSAEVRQDFEDHLAQDADLRAQLEIMQKLQKGIHAAGREQLRKEVFPRQQIPFMIRLNTKWKLAVPIAFFVMAIIAYNLIFPLENERLFKSYYARIDSLNLGTPRGESGPYKLKTRAFTEYSNKNFDAALGLLKQIDEPDDESAFLSGLVNIELENWEQAKEQLKIARDGSEVNADAATWYLALVQIRTKDFKSAKISLNELTGRAGPFHSRAVKLIGELK